MNPVTDLWLDRLRDEVHRLLFDVLQLLQVFRARVLLVRREPGHVPTVSDFAGVPFPKFQKKCGCKNVTNALAYHQRRSKLIADFLQTF